MEHHESKLIHFQSLILFLTGRVLLDNVSVSNTNTNGGNVMNTELIRKRKSVRTYKAEPIPMELMNQVKTYLKKDNGTISYMIYDLFFGSMMCLLISRY